MRLSIQKLLSDINVRKMTIKKIVIVIITGLLCLDVFLLMKVDYLKKDKIEILNNADIGDIVEFGLYEQDSELSSKESIRWIVLDKQENQLFLLSEKIIDVKQYEENEHGQVKWIDSSLNTWLNNNFFNEAFSKEEKEQISNLQGEKISILTYDDVEKYLNQSNYLLAEPSEWAIENELYYNSKTKASSWWIKQGNIAASVESDGMILTLINNGAGIAPEGVRPCMWININ